MASMRKLRRRLLRWQRYDARARKLVPEFVDRGLRNGHYRAARAVAEEQNRRHFAGRYMPVCDACGLPDPYRGAGDGIGSCDCPRCDCGSARGSSLCGCPLDDWDDEYEDDEPAMRVDTVLAFQEAGLL